MSKYSVTTAKTHLENTHISCHGLNVDIEGTDPQADDTLLGDQAMAMIAQFPACCTMSFGTTTSSSSLRESS